MRKKTLEQIPAQDFAGLQVDMLSKLRNGNITIEQLKWFLNLQFQKREELLGKKLVSEILKPLSISGLDSDLEIESLDGTETLSEAHDVFSSIGNRFMEWETGKPSSSTGPTKPALYELKENATFLEMFESLGGNENLALTQAQIKRFCKKYARLLFKSGIDTIFLPFNLQGNYFIASVRPQRLPEGTKPSITLYSLNFNDTWFPDYGDSRKFKYAIVTS